MTPEIGKRNKRQFSRRRYAAVLKMLNKAVATEGLSWGQKLRAAELVLLIYGTPLPESGKRDKKTIRELVTEHTFDRAIVSELNQLDRSVEAKTPTALMETTSAAKEIGQAALLEAAFADVLAKAEENDRAKERKSRSNSS